MLKKIAQVLKKNNTFLITTHLHPDGDAIGSEIVFLGLLEDMGKEVIALNDTPLPPPFRFLPASRKITTEIPSNFRPQIAITMPIWCDRPQFQSEHPFMTLSYIIHQVYCRFIIR